MAEKRDLTMNQGETWDPAFILRNPDKSYFNLTGYSARMQVRATYDSDTVLIEATTVNGKLVLNPTLGRVGLTLVPADTSPIEFSGESLSGVYDLEVVSSGGVVTRVAEGSFTLLREVTR